MGGGIVPARQRCEKSELIAQRLHESQTCLAAMEIAHLRMLRIRGREA